VGYEPTRSQKEAFTRVLHLRILPHVTDVTVLHHHLELCRWDVDAAYSRLSANRQTLRASVVTGGPFVPITGVAIYDDCLHDLPFSNDVEHERRDTAVSFRDLVKKNMGEDLAVSEAMLLLYLGDWDLARAVQHYQDMDDALDRLHINFDRMRSSEGTKITHGTDDQQARHDERPAVLLDITARSDWVAIQNHLALHKYNLVAALVSWFKHGIAVAHGSGKDRKTRMDVNRQPLPLPDAADTAAPGLDEEWAVERRFYRRVADFSSEESVPLPVLREGPEEGKKGRFFGYLIRSDKSTVPVGNLNAGAFFLIEYIHKGRYKALRSTGRQHFRWQQLNDDQEVSDENDQSDEPAQQEDHRDLFDFKNSTHVKLLNDWRRQVFRRVTGIITRQAVQVWTYIEHAFLYQLLQAYRAESVQHNDQDPQATLQFTRQTYEEFADRLNEQFAGTIAPGATQVRQLCNPQAIETQARRFWPNVNDLKAARDNVWVARKSAGNNNKLEKLYQKHYERPAEGQRQLATWDLVARRVSNSSESSGDVGSQSSTGFDHDVDEDDSDATAERKRHETRSRKKLVAEVQADKARRAARRTGLVNDGESDSGRWQEEVHEAGK
jgi:hypothetical protein